MHVETISHAQENIMSDSLCKVLLDKDNCLPEILPYMLNFVVRKQLEKVLSWKVGVMTNFSVSVGKSAKYMYKWLSEQEWEKSITTQKQRMVCIFYNQ